MANKINLDTSTRLDIICRKGDTFSIGLTIKDGADKQDLTSDKFAMQVRTRASREGANGLLITTNPAQESIDDGTSAPVLPLKNANIADASAVFTVDRGSNVSDDGDFGILTIKGTALQMSEVPSGRYVYDIQHYVDSSESQKTILHGSFVVNDDITEVGQL